MPRYKPLKALKKLIRGQEQTSQQPNENTDNSAELKWELKNDYRLTDEELNGMSPAQLQQKQLDMQEKRKNALTRLKTKTSVPENAAQSMSYLKILEHLDRIASLESNTEAANTRYVIQENGQGIERTINNNPAPANHPPPGHRPAVQLGDTDRYQWIEISESTRLNETLLEDHANTNLIKDWSRSAPQRQWIPHLSLGEIELVIGLDFGTTNTKVVIRDKAKQEMAWAVPFNQELEKHYLLKSGVYLEQDCYSFKGFSENLKSNLKTPLILGEFDNEETPHLIAFLALVIRYSRNWFLHEHGHHYRRNKLIWVYNLGMPSEIFNRHNESTEEHFKQLLCQGVMAANKTENRITKASIEFLLNEELCEETQAWCQVIPEIQAQLIGHIESDKYDPDKRRFMIIDIGGGTADTAIVSLTDNPDFGNKTYNCMSSVVKPLGIEMLHDYRLKWIDTSIDRNRVENSLLREQLKQSGDNFPLERYPGDVSEYLHDAIFPEKFSIDELFYSEVSSKLFHGPINEAKRLDPRTYLDRNQPLQFFFCGGGSHHPLMAQMRNVTTHNTTRRELPMPEELEAPDLDPDNFHRISVAYGLSFDSHGDFIPVTQIAPIPRDELLTPHGNPFIGPEQM